jgi:glycosyltransferase involved in cell wall biosynthesis
MHGVDHDHFAVAVDDNPERERPSDLPEGRIVGFFGLLSEWLDQELLIKLARALQSTGSSTPGGTQASASSVTEPVTLQDTNQQPATSRSLVLIGTADVPVDRLKSEPNIFMLGPKPFSELPRYVRHFDIGIIPFVVNDLTRAVNPIKLREMLAAGCPVVSTALPEVERIAECGKSPPDSTVVAHTYDEFISAVKRSLQSSLSMEERRIISDSMTGETWQAKVGEILEIITGEGQTRMKDEG